MKQSLLTAVAGLCLAGSAFAQTPADIPPGLIAWWRGEDNPKDAVGGADGTMQGGVGFAEGNTGQAFNFTGNSGQTVQVPASDEIDIGASPAGFAIEFWVNPANASGYPLMEWSNPGGGSGVHIWANLFGDGSVYFNWDSGGNTLITAPGLIPTGAWHHIAFSYNKPSGMSRLYINGVEAATRNVGSIRALTTSALTLGHRAGGGTMHGKLDEVSLYNRPLSVPEISAIFQAGTAGKDTTKPYFIKPDTFPDGGVGTPYSVQFAAAVTPGPHTFAITGGTLPPGLDFHSDGLLHGTPTAPAAVDLAITATSSLGQTNTRVFSLNVSPCLDPSPTGMVVWWRGQDDALDAIGTHHGTLQNGMTYTTGLVGRGFELDGANDYMSVSTDGIPTGNAPRTVEFWMKTTDTRTVAPCFYGGESPGNSFYPVLFGGRIGIGWWGGGDVIGTKVVNDAQWHHVAMAYDGAGTTRLYVDGVLDATAGGRSYATSSGSFVIGGALGHALYGGQLDEFTIYDRALTAEEALALYNAHNGGKCGALHLTTLSPLPGAGEGTAYSQMLELGGGTAPYEFALHDGTLPPGLELSTSGVISGTPSGFGTSNFTVRVTDAETRPTERHYYLKVNARPVLGAISGQTVDEESLMSLSNAATDSDTDNTLTYELLDPPPGAVIDAAGTITWTPTEAQGPGVFTFTTRVTDDGTPPLSATNSFTVTVNEINAPPSLATQANRTLDELALLTVPNGGTDIDQPANNLTYTLVAAPAGAAIDAAGTITWTPTEAQGPGAFTLTTRVTDDGNPPMSATNSFTVTVNEINAPPSLPTQANRTLDELALLTVPNGGTDIDQPANNLTYTLVAAPAGAAIDAAGTITWTPTEAQGPGVFTFTTRVTDDGTPPLSATNSFTVTVNEINAPPSLPTQANRTLDELALLTVANGGTDIDQPANNLTYTLLAAPAGAAIDAAGTITWTPTEAQGPGAFTLTTRVTDDGTPPMSATNSFTVTVNEINTPPSLPEQEDTTVEQFSQLTVDQGGSDADLPANALTYTLTESPPGAAISPAGVITWTPTEDQGPGTYTITTRVTDNGSPPLTDTKSFTVTVTEPPPVFVEISNRRVENNEIHLEVHGPPGNYIISISSDLIGWSLLATINGASPPFEVVDPIPTGRQSRFYKATRIR